MGLPGYYGGLLNSYTELEGTENQMALLGGYFKPAGTGAPTAISDGKNWWSVKRTGVGVYVLTFLGNFANKFGTLAETQCILAGMQVDTAGSDLNLAAVVGPVVNNTVTIYVYDTNTGAKVDPSQPGSPNAQGTSVHWAILQSNDNSFEAIKTLPKT